MPIYIYKAVDEVGKTIENTITASSESQVRQQLAELPLVVFEIKQLSSNNKPDKLKLKPVKKTLWVRQLATLLNAGYTLEKALLTCCRQSQDGQLKRLSEVMHERLVEGIPFHKILAGYPKVFDSAFCATVKAGESSGHLDVVLERLADYEETVSEMRGNIKQALIYPIVLTVVASLLIAYLMTSVIPDVVKIFNHSEQELPAITKGLLYVSNFIGNYGLLLGIAIIASIFFLKRFFSQSENRLYLDQKILCLPIFGKISIGYHTANFSGTLSILLKSGVKLTDAMNISAKTLTNVALRQVADNAYRELQKGKSLAQSLESKNNFFPGMFLDLIDSGERTGGLTQMLEKSSEIYQKQSRSELATLVSLLGPFMILIMGGLIFVIVLAILLPIFDLNQAIQ